MTPRDQRPLPDTLTCLGIEELRERLEISPLLADPNIQGQDLENCCSCKIPNDPAPDSPGDTDIGE